MSGQKGFKENLAALAFTGNYTTPVIGRNSSYTRIDVDAYLVNITRNFKVTEIFSYKKWFSNNPTKKS